MDKDLAKESIRSLARHIGTVAAGALLTNGVIGEDMTQQVIAVVSGLVILGWSMLQKRLARRNAVQKGARFDKAA